MADPFIQRVFDLWKKDVDRWLMKLVGVDSDGLPDWDLWAGFQRKMKPEEAAREIIEAAKEF